MVNPLFVAFDLAVVVLAIRSVRLTAGRAPATTVGWVLAGIYGAAAAIEFSTPPLHAPMGRVAFVALIALAAAFIVAAVRDEPPTEPWWWPRGLGPTRAQRRKPSA